MVDAAGMPGGGLVFAIITSAYILGVCILFAVDFFADWRDKD